MYDSLQAAADLAAVGIERPQAEAIVTVIAKARAATIDPCVSFEPLDAVHDLEAVGMERIKGEALVRVVVDAFAAQPS